ncbi:S24/S26 family peptidase [Sphingobacterium siyangense]|uniref:S24/S26 family peptidase n=1 Tax=Sphingobacterium siyangense TaxID=459529 RepID=UPI00200CF30E|nr:S24/S26 family peptidase [Sphingobacterium siyangense]UQA75576.1 S24/S26 family peptidase [Sphingobacterium siyangense]
MPENKHENEIRVISNEDYFAEVQRILREGKEVRIRVKGNSMRPFIQDGDTVLLRAYSGPPLPLGSNILAKENDKFVFHRFVGKKNGQYILAGDGNLVLREYIAETDIIAIAYMHYPKDKELSIAIHLPWARLRGLGWYYIRLLRRIVLKFKSLTQKN